MRIGPNADPMTPTGTPEEVNMPASTWIAALHSIVPGSLPTYDWRTKEKLAPLLLKANMPPNWYTYAVFDQFLRVDAAGLILPNTCSTEQIMETAQLFDPAEYFVVSALEPPSKKPRTTEETAGSASSDPGGSEN